MVVVALGHRLTAAEAHPHLRERVEEAIEARRAAEGDALVLSGGRTTPGLETAECEAMAAYAVERGVDPGRLHLEDRALDTVGNGYFSRLLIDALERDVDAITVVTADYHADRAAYVFEQCFGDDYRIDSSRHVETAITPDQHEESRRLERTRAFFEGIEPGDVTAIRRRLVDAHDLYDEAAVASGRRA